MILLLDLVIARLKAANLGFRAVESIEALADLETVAVARPACFVLPASTDYRATQAGGGLLNMEATERLDIVVMVDGALKLGRRQNEMMALAAAVIDELFGWTPDRNVWRPLEPEASRLLGVGGGRASYLVRFRTVAPTALRKTGVI